jgi:uncharacterized protein
MKKLFWSKYNYKFQSEKYGYLLYNSSTNSFIGIEKIKNEINNLEKNQNNFYKLSDSLQKILLNMKVITENSDEDFLNYLKFKSFSTKSYQKSKSYTVIPTLDCNFRCTYCFELNAKNNKKIYMNKKVENAIVKQMIGDYKENKTHFDITWYGGEPLLAFDTIERISQELIQNKVPLTARMITNGYLLNENVISKLEKYKIQFLQITIDGNRETHNKKRPHETNPNSYERIIENIKNLYKITSNVSVSIRVNLDQTNKNEFNYLKNELSSLFPKSDIYPAIIRDVPINSNCISISNCMNKKNEVAFWIEQFEKHRNDKINYYPSLMGIEDCAATGLYNWIVGPEGELYKCWNDVGENNKIIGSIINNSITNVQLLSRYIVGVDPTEDIKCRNCFYLPICGGGCPYNRIMNKYENKKIINCIMQKGSKVLEKFLEIQYEINKKNKLIKEVEV